MALRRKPAKIGRPQATQFDLDDFDNHNLSQRISKLPQLANKRAMAILSSVLRRGKLADEDTVDVDWRLVDGSRQQMANEVWQQKKAFGKKVELRDTVKTIKDIVMERVERDCSLPEDVNADKDQADRKGISRKLKGAAGDYEKVDRRIDELPWVDFAGESKLQSWQWKLAKASKKTSRKWSWITGSSGWRKYSTLNRSTKTRIRWKKAEQGLCP